MKLCKENVKHVYAVEQIKLEGINLCSIEMTYMADQSLFWDMVV